MIVDTYRIAMRDGISLYTSVVKPQASGKFPIVLVRTPYCAKFDVQETAENFLEINKAMFGSMFKTEFTDFISNDYCIVFQHCRGTGNSEGEHVLSLKDSDDACDTLDWIRQQDFYNGEIFRFGASYLGMTSLIDAKARHKDVKGIVAMAPCMWFDLSLVNGVYDTGWRGLWTATMESNYAAPKGVINRDLNMFRTFPQKDWGKLIVGHEDYMYTTNNAHPFHADPFWRSPDAPGYEIYESLESLETPTLFISGWLDVFTKANQKAWNDMIPKETREKSSMVFVPYGHIITRPQEGWAGFEMDGSELATFSEHYAVNWFNHLRTGEELVNVREGQIAFFPEAGNNKWYYEKGVLSEGTAKELYLNEGRVLGDAPGFPDAITYLYNPYNPAIFMSPCERTNGTPNPARSKNDPYDPIMAEQDAPNSRYDIISFTGKKIEKHCFIKGTIRTKLTVKSDCEDTCFYVRVCIVKDGIAYGVRDDIRTLCHELGNYIPGEAVELNFEMTPLVWELFPGDELRVDVSSSCFPHFAPHTNVKAEIQAEVEKPKYANNTIICGASSVSIPFCKSLDHLDSIALSKQK